MGQKSRAKEGKGVARRGAGEFRGRVWRAGWQAGGHTGFRCLKGDPLRAMPNALRGAGCVSTATGHPATNHRSKGRR